MTRIRASALCVLVKWQVLINTIRNIHKTICGAASTCCRSGWCACRPTEVTTMITVTGCLALCKFLVFYYYLCGIDLLAFPVGVASGLDSSTDCDLDTLTEIFFSELCCSAECHTADKISGCFPVSFESSVNSQCISRDCQ